MNSALIILGYAVLESVLSRVDDEKREDLSKLIQAGGEVGIGVAMQLWDLWQRQGGDPSAEAVEQMHADWAAILGEANAIQHNPT